MRLRTLPLSLSGVVLGVFLAFASEGLHPSVPTVCFLLLTTVLLQILSNLSNELGDTLNGTDRDDREGIRYSLQDGDLSIPEMKRLIVSVAAACCLSGLAMVFCSFGKVFAPEPLALLVLGATAIWAAMHYTLGKNPYGYRGLGDVFVFLFFGFVSVGGAYYVCTHGFDFRVLLPAGAIGCFSVGVLNLNNIRDMKSDAATRMTVAMKMGPHRARIYQTILLSLGWVLMFVFTALTASSWTAWLFVLTLPFYALHLKGVWTRQDRALDPLLPLLVLSTFFLSLLAGVGMIVSFHADVVAVDIWFRLPVGRV